MSWPSPQYAPDIFGLRLLHDGPVGTNATVAIARAVLRTNPRITPAAALVLSDAAVGEARRADIPPEFFAALLLQESAFDPRALSPAGAIGIAQFMPDTAGGLGVNPFDPFDAIHGAAALVSSYAHTYRVNAFVKALAAYNAGPGAVEAYRGVPPYAQTRDYINDVFDRWAKIVDDEQPRNPQ